MNAKGYGSIPRELCYWITFLSEALPPRSIGTFIELLIGAMLTPTGFVTDAYLVVNMQNHWTSYYKWLQEGRRSWLALARQFFRLVLKVVGGDVVYLVIDDTLTLRASKKAPGSQIHHQHGNKPNLARFVRGQKTLGTQYLNIFPGRLRPRFSLPKFPLQKPLCLVNKTVCT